MRPARGPELARRHPSAARHERYLRPAYSERVRDHELVRVVRRPTPEAGDKHSRSGRVGRPVRERSAQLAEPIKRPSPAFVGAIQRPSQPRSDSIERGRVQVALLAEAPETSVE